MPSFVESLDWKFWITQACRSVKLCVAGHQLDMWGPKTVFVLARILMKGPPSQQLHQPVVHKLLPPFLLLVEQTASGIAARQ